MMMSYKIVNEQEFKLLNTKNYLVRQDIEWIIENQDIFIKYLTNIQNTYRTTLANLQAIGKEGEVYIWIKTIEKIIEWIKLLPKEIETLEKIEKEKKAL